MRPFLLFLLLACLNFPVLAQSGLTISGHVRDASNGEALIGANVYVMSMQFDALQGPIASSLVLSTVSAAFTTPLLLAATAAFY